MAGSTTMCSFPSWPKLGRYVWNLADFAILLGGLLLTLFERKK